MATMMRSETRNRCFMLVITFCLWFSMYVFAPYYTPYLLAAGIAQVTVGVINGLYGFMQMVTKIPAGLYTDSRQKYKPFVVAGLACGAAACFLMGASSHETVMFIGRTLTGFATSIWSLYLVMYTRTCTDEPAPVAIARMQFASFLGRLAAYAVSAWILTHHEMMWVFFCGGFVALSGTLLSFFIREVPLLPLKPGQRGSVLRRLGVIREPNLLFCSLLMMLYQLVSFATVANYTQVVAKSLGASTTQLSAISTLNMVLAMSSTLLMNVRAMNRVRLSRLIGLSFLFLGAYCLLVPVCSTVPQLIVCSAAGGFAGGFIYTRLSSACIERVGSGEKSTAMGYHQAIYALGITLGPPVMSRLMAGYGPWHSFLFMSALCFLSAAACSVLFPLLERKKEENPAALPQ